MADNNFWFWMVKRRLELIPYVWCYNRKQHAFVCVWCLKSGRPVTTGPSCLLCHVFHWTRCLVSCDFQKYSVMGKDSPQPPPPPPPPCSHTWPNTVRTQRLLWHDGCWLWPVPVPVSFTDSFTPPCHASPHPKSSEHWLFVQAHECMGRTLCNIESTTHPPLRTSPSENVIFFYHQIHQKVDVVRWYIFIFYTLFTSSTHKSLL